MKTISILLLIFSVVFSQQYTTSKFDPTVQTQNMSLYKAAPTNEWSQSEMASDLDNMVSPQKIVSAYNSLYPAENPIIFTIGIKYTLNGGQTWNQIDSLPNADNLGLASDPGCAFDLNGNVYVSYIAYGNGHADEVRYNYSTNGGSNWSEPITVYTAPSGYGVDRPNIAIDNVQSSPYKNRKYFAWSKSQWSESQRVYLLTNGIMFITPALQDQAKTISTDVGWGVDMDTDTNGNLYVVWCDFKGHVRMCKSTDGGHTFGATKTIASDLINPQTVGNTALGARYYPSIAIDKSNFKKNRIYVTYHSGISTDIDVFLIYSDDGGDTWSSPKMVNNDKTQGTTNNKCQWFPWISVNNNGVVHIVFYDGRNTSSYDQAETYTAYSYDGGLTFVNEATNSGQFTLFQMSGTRPGYYTDYLSIVAFNSGRYPFWTRPSENIYHLYYQKMNNYVDLSFTNKIGSSNAGGKLSVNNGTSQNSGFSEQLALNSYNNVKTENERFDDWHNSGNTYKHNNWNDQNEEYFLSHNFYAKPNNNQNANFKVISPATVKTDISGNSGNNGGTIYFKDPWYVDENKNQPDDFLPFSTPYSPTGNANEATGGVFLNQGYSQGNWAPPYYEVKADAQQTFTAHGQDITGYFLNWEGTDVSFQ